MHRRSVEFTTRFKEVLARIDGIAGAKTRETTARENTQRFTPACSACRFPSATRSPEAITSLSTSAPYLRSHGLRVLTICLVSIGAIAASVAMQSTRSESFTTCATPGKGVCTLMPSTHNVHMCPLKLLPLNYLYLRPHCWPFCAQRVGVSSHGVDPRRMADGASWGPSRYA
jgi:hypothetical protein